MYIADVAHILHCCGSGSRPAATAPIGPLAWKPPYAAGTAQETAKKKDKKKKKIVKEETLTTEQSNDGSPKC